MALGVGTTTALSTLIAQTYDPVFESLRDTEATFLGMLPKTTEDNDVPRWHIEANDQNPVWSVSEADLTAFITSTNTATDGVVVTVLKAPAIPNTFSPNGDGIHDRWEIKYLDTYPGATVEIFNRYGQPVFKSTGYGRPWDGTLNGKPLPAGTYYYIINPKNGRKQIAGFVDIIR